MKNKLTLTLALAALSFSSFATTWTVSNRADKPAQYTQVQPAIDNAQPGDTIIIAGSETTYTGFTVNRRIIFFGEGINNPDGQNTNVGLTNPNTGYSIVLTNVNSGIGSSGSQFYGINMNSGLYIAGDFSGQQVGENKIENIVFDRCQISGNGVQFVNQIYNNWTFRNCLFLQTMNFNTSSVTNILITNSIFTYLSSAHITSSSGAHNLNGQVFIRNSNFMNRSAADVFQAKGLVVENCIFYGGQPTGATTSTFNNNLTFANSNNALPYGDNVGSGNLVGVDPLFTTFPVIGGAFTFSQNFALKPSSPALGTGTNGTNIGITGGNAPVVSNLPGNSKLPVVTEINVPVSSVPVGGTLQINVKAKTRN